MKNSNYLVAAGAAFLLSLGGCSLTPYDSEFSCNKGVSGGMCDSVTNTYIRSFNKKRNIAIDEAKNNSTVIKSEAEEKAKESCSKIYIDIFESCPTTHQANKCEKTKNKRRLNYLECLDKEYSNFLDESNKNTEEVYEMLYFQRLENERLRQKAQLGEQKND